MPTKRLGTAVLIVIAAGAAALVALPAWLAAQPADAGAATPPEPELTARGFLGVAVHDLTPELRRHFGVEGAGGLLVASVAGGSPAAAAGIEVGDVLVAVAGSEVASSRQLRRAIRRLGGETVTVELVRDGTPRRHEVTLGERPMAAIGAAEVWPPDGTGSWNAGQWQEWAEHWQGWGEQMAETWGRFGAEMGEEWGRRGAEMGELGAEMGGLGADIGLEVARAMAEIDWSELGLGVERSMRSLEEVDWEEISRQIERSLEQAGREIERSLEQMDRELDRAEAERDPKD